MKECGIILVLWVSSTIELDTVRRNGVLSCDYFTSSYKTHYRSDMSIFDPIVGRFLNTTKSYIALVECNKIRDFGIYKRFQSLRIPAFWSPGQTFTESQLRAHNPSPMPPC